MVVYFVGVILNMVVLVLAFLWSMFNILKHLSMHLQHFWQMDRLPGGNDEKDATSHHPPRNKTREGHFKVPPFCWHMITT